MAPSLGDGELRGDVLVVLADDDAGIGLASALDLAAGDIAVAEAVDPHLRHRQRVDAFGEGNAAAGVGVAGEQGLEAGLGKLRLEIAGYFQDRGAGTGAIGDADDAPFEPPRIGRLAILEACCLHPRRVKVLHDIAGDDAAGEPADAGIVPCARHVAGLRGGGDCVQAEHGGEDEHSRDVLRR